MTSGIDFVFQPVTIGCVCVCVCVCEREKVLLEQPELQ